MKNHLLLSILLALLAAPLVQAQTATAVNAAMDNEADYEAVRQAALDYVEGIYNVEPERIERSVHPDLAKVGYWWSKDDAAYQEDRMTYDELVSLAGRWNKNGRVDPATAPKEIQVLDLMDKTAVVKLRADWGVDHMHLAKIDGKWMIVNVLWQSIPPTQP